MWCRGPCITAIIVVSSEKVCVNLRVLVHLHFLLYRVSKFAGREPNQQTYHLESIELLLDLLGKHWCETIAGSNLSSSVVLSARPGIVELDTRAECGTSLHSALWSRRYALGVSLESQG